MGNFVTSNTALPTPKTDTAPPLGDTSHLNAGDINDLWGAAGDLRLHGSGQVNVMEYMSVQGVIDADCSTAFASALAAGSLVYVPPGTYPLASSITVPSGKSLIGAGAQSSTLSYSGASGCIILDGCQGSRVENIKILTTSTNAGVRGIWLKNTSALSQWNRVSNCLIIQFSGTGRNAGQVGLLIEDNSSSTLAQFCHYIENNRFLNWETCIELLQSGTGLDGVNQSHFTSNTCYAFITGMLIGPRCNDHVISGLFGSHSSVATFTDTLLVIGDAVGGASDNNICNGIVSDMGANGKAFNIANGLNNFVVANNESGLADIDAGLNSFAVSTKNLSGFNQRIRLPNFAAGNSSALSGTLLLGKSQETETRVISDTDTVVSTTTDLMIIYGSITADRTATLPAPFLGGKYIFYDASGSASGTKRIIVSGNINGSNTTAVAVNSANGTSTWLSTGSTWFKSASG